MELLWSYNSNKGLKINGSGEMRRVLSRSFSENLFDLEVRHVKGSMNGLLAIVCLAIAVASFYFYRQNARTILLVAFVIFVIGTVVFGGMFLSGRVNKTEDIHITE